jgi:hypothetical protein
MPIFQKGTDSFTTVKDIYLCTGANAFSRICKVYICTGANTFQLVYDGCGFACDGYFVSGSCPATRIVNYYGIGNADSTYAQSNNLTYSNNYGSTEHYWNMTTYQCSSCPPPGNIIVEYQTCPESTGNISPYLFVNRGLDRISNHINSCFVDNVIDDVIIASVNSYLPLVNNLTDSKTTNNFGNDPGICTCVDENDWKIPNSINYITSKTQDPPSIQITVNNDTWANPSGLDCDSSTGFRENLIPSSGDYSKTYSKYGIFWGADSTSSPDSGINTSNSCPIYCYGSSGGGSTTGDVPEGYACKSIAKLPLIVGTWNSSISSTAFTGFISSDIKYNNNNTSTNRSLLYRLFNLGFGVKINSGSPKWKIKITYPVYFSQKELEDFYNLTTSNYT